MQQEALDRPLDELELSVRTSVALDKVGLRYVGELVQVSEEALIKQHRFGKRSMRELTTMLGELGLGLGMSFPAWSPPG